MSEFHYGGQAVIEGVMMRGKHHMAVAVRKPSGDIFVHSEPLSSWIYKHPIFKWPFVRGLTMLWDQLVLGMRVLMFSADVALEEEGVEFGGPVVWGTVLFSLLLGVAPFIVVPMLLVGLVDRYITSSVLSNLAAGLVRLLFYVTYLVAVGRMPDSHWTVSTKGIPLCDGSSKPCWRSTPPRPPQRIRILRVFLK